jgi:hypothetical protein
VVYDVADITSRKAMEEDICPETANEWYRRTNRGTC